MRALLLLTAAILAGCGPSAPPAEQAHKDLTLEPWYAPTTQQLASMVQQAEQLLQAGRGEEAATIVSNGQPLQSRLLSASRPTLEAMEAVSDMDQLYAQMLLNNHYYGSARMLLQMNVTRWKNWKPQTPETERRLKSANAGIAECDRHMGG